MYSKKSIFAFEYIYYLYSKKSLIYLVVLNVNTIFAMY